MFKRRTPISNHELGRKAYNALQELKVAREVPRKERDAAVLFRHELEMNDALDELFSRISERESA